MRLTRLRRDWPCWDCSKESPSGEVGLGLLHHFTTFFACSEVFRIVILVEVIEEICFDVLEFEIGFMEFVVAVVAEPKQTVFESFAYANAFDD